MEPPVTLKIILVRIINDMGIFDYRSGIFFSLFSSLIGFPLNVTLGVTSLSKATKRGHFLHLHTVGRELVPPHNHVSTINSHFILYHVCSLHLRKLKAESEKIRQQAVRSFWLGKGTSGHACSLWLGLTSCQQLGP